MMQNFEHLAYTYRHRRAIFYLVDALITDPVDHDEMMRRAELHDMDKMLMYLTMEKKEASRRHRESAPHHIENGLPKTRYDYMEAILDYESAGYTKPDKPLNAYDTVFKLKNYDEHTNAQLMDIMVELGIASSYNVTEDAEGMAYISQYYDVTPEMIAEEVKWYIDELAYRDDI